MAETTEVARLEAEVEALREVLIFADGLAVSNTGYCLSELYAADYAKGQGVLQRAGCWPRGTFHPQLA